MHKPSISVLGDSTIVPSKCYSKHDSDRISSTPGRSLRRAISIPAVSSIVKDSWNWAGDTLSAYRGGPSAEEQKRQADIEDRKQVLYLKIKNVSTFYTLGVASLYLDGRLHLLRHRANHDSEAAGSVVRGMV